MRRPKEVKSKEFVIFSEDGFFTGLINGGQPEGMSDNDWSDCLKRNKEHLVIMLAKDFWTTQDLTPLETASK